MQSGQGTSYTYKKEPIGTPTHICSFLFAVSVFVFLLSYLRLHCTASFGSGFCFRGISLIAIGARPADVDPPGTVVAKVKT